MAKLSNVSPRARRSTRSASAQPRVSGLKGTRGRPRKSIETDHLAPQPARAASRAGRQTTKTTKASSAPRAHNMSNKLNHTQTATSTLRNSTRSSRSKSTANGGSFRRLFFLVTKNKTLTLRPECPLGVCTQFLRLGRALFTISRKPIRAAEMCNCHMQK